MLACMQQGSLAPRGLARFVATMSPSDSRRVPHQVMFSSDWPALARPLARVSQVSDMSFCTCSLLTLRPAPPGAFNRFFPGRWQASSNPRGWPPVVLEPNEADSSSPLAGLGLMHLSSEGFRPSSPGPLGPDRCVPRALSSPPAAARLYVERSIFIIGTFQPNRHASVTGSTGIGFDMQFKEKVFQIFQRLHSTAEYPGTGIGLAIVRKAVERVGGRVDVESEPGKGASFSIAIPV